MVPLIKFKKRVMINIMRDPKRIDKFCNKIAEYWKLYPDYRFGQLIYLIADELKVNDIFFPEDNIWTVSIQNIIDRKEQ